MKKSKITCKYKNNGKTYTKTISVDFLPCDEQGFVSETKITNLLKTILPQKSIIVWQQARCEAWNNL